MCLRETASSLGWAAVARGGGNSSRCADSFFLSLQNVPFSFSFYLYLAALGCFSLFVPFLETNQVSHYFTCNTLFLPQLQPPAPQHTRFAASVCPFIVYIVARVSFSISLFPSTNLWSVFFFSSFCLPPLSARGVFLVFLHFFFVFFFLLLILHFHSEELLSFNSLLTLPIYIFILTLNAL